MAQSTEQPGDSGKNPLITDPNHAGLLKTLDFYQNIIARMAENSRQCKTWAITLFSGMLIWALRGGDQRLIVFAIVPVVALGLLDLYYLQLERRYRNGYKKLVAGFRDGALQQEHLFELQRLDNGFNEIKESSRQEFLGAIKYLFHSPSTFLFYAVLALFVIGGLAFLVLNPPAANKTLGDNGAVMERNAVENQAAPAEIGATPAGENNHAGPTPSEDNSSEQQPAANPETKPESQEKKPPKSQ